MYFSNDILNMSSQKKFSKKTHQKINISSVLDYELNGNDDEFLEANDFSREEIMMGIQDLADRYNLSGIAEAFRTEIL